MTDWIVPLARFEEELEKEGQRYWQGLSRGTMRILLFKPKDRDVQQPHGQDEIYIVHTGSGTFSKSGEVHPVQAGDVIFVEAGVEHRFETFSDDFSSWVIFWGPQGGEGKAG
jgi:mannose-6-phosphate isomerase-like protein (cupin superfamily)